MLNQEQLDFYKENGYVHVKGLLGRDEALSYRDEGHEVIRRVRAIEEEDATWKSAADAVMTKEKTQLWHCHNVQFQSAMFGKLMVDNRITDIASQIIGSPNVQLHHNKMFIKPPEKGSPFPMHQDAPFFPHDKHSMIAVILHFDDAPEEKGCLRCVPGSHKLGMLEHIKEGGHHLPVTDYPLEDAVILPAKAGDALFFSYLTIHGSGVNVSDEYRTTWLIQMRDPEDLPTIDTHKSRGQGTMLRGYNPLAN